MHLIRRIGKLTIAFKPKMKLGSFTSSCSSKSWLNKMHG